jgi:hypothetical protein
VVAFSANEKCGKKKSWNSFCRKIVEFAKNELIF